MRKHIHAVFLTACFVIGIYSGDAIRKLVRSK
jgi:hypothetical protein